MSSPSPEGAAFASRYRPHRVGIVNLWDYSDETFEFADGRLILRGPNGSGKTKALEVLFPFLLDANLAPRRLDPFSGEGRTMKHNLLYRGDRDANYGYVWVEFRRPLPDGDHATVTVGAGLRAHRHREGVGSWYFVTDRSLGSDLSLIDREGRPLTRRQLADQLGEDAVFERAADYRSRVDRVLFGLGPERYDALVHLVLYLRRPHLARDLDLGRLSTVLSQGLRPLDDELLDQAARSFEDLEAVQRELEALESARRAVDAFLDRYRHYVRALARSRADEALERQAALAEAERALARAGARHEQAVAERDAATRHLERTAARLAGSRAERDALIASPAYRDVQQLEHLELRVDDHHRELGSVVAQAAEAERRLGELTAHHDRAQHAAQEAARQLATASAQAAESAARASIDWPVADSGPAFGVDPAVVADAERSLRSLLAARRADVRVVTRHLAAEERSTDRAGEAEARHDDAVMRSDAAREALETAEAAVAHEREKLHAVVDAWASEATIDVVTDEDRAALHAAVGTFGTPAAPSLADTFRVSCEPRREELAVAVDRAERRVAELRSAIEALNEERERVAGETDDAPPRPPTRAADREDRPGAPLWRLVDFAPAVEPAERAGLEAALEAAGILDAWVLPGGGSSPTGHATASLVGVPDTFLRAGESHTGPTLADVLVPDPAATGVDPRTVTTLLRTIPLAGAGLDGQIVSVGTDGGFRLGPLQGAGEKPGPHYIGAAAREERRSRRLAGLDDEIARADAARADAEEGRRRTLALIAALDDALAALPTGGELVEATREIAQVAARLAEARRHADECRDAHERAVELLAAARGALEREAAARGLPSSATELEGVAHALERFEEDGGRVVRLLEVRAERLVRSRDLAESREAQSRGVERLRADRGERETRLEALRHELATLRETLGADAQAVLARLERLDHLLVDLEGEAETGRERELAAVQEVGQAEGDQEGGRQRVLDSRVRYAEAVQRLAVLRRPELVACLEIAQPAVAEAATGSPRQDAAALGSDTESDPVVPSWAEAFLAALDAATSGVSVHPERLKAVRTAVTHGFEELMSTLGSSYQPEHDLDDDIVTVTVVDDDGPQSATGFAAKLARLCAEHAALLSERERKVFEDTLLSSLCAQLHERTLEARDQLRRMNNSLREREMSSGLRIQLRWEPLPDEVRERRAAARLLDQDPALLGAEERDDLRDHFAREVKAVRAADPGRSYRELLGAVFDYRQWRHFALRLVHADGTDEALSSRSFNKLSGGEKATSLHLPLFAAAAAHYSSAAPFAPHLIALDEAFAGIDEATQARLMGLAVEFDLDLFLTGHDLWGTFPSVPAVAIYDLMHLREEHAVHAMRFRWDGTALSEVATDATVVPA